MLWGSTTSIGFAYKSQTKKAGVVGIYDPAGPETYEDGQRITKDPADFVKNIFKLGSKLEDNYTGEELKDIQDEMKLKDDDDDEEEEGDEEE